MRHRLATLCLCLCGLYFSCKHVPQGQEGALSLEGVAVELWTDGDMLFAWGQVEGHKARVVFSSVELGNTLTKNKHCAVGQRTGKVLAAGEEREALRLRSWSVEGKALGSLEVALVEAPPAPTPSTWLRLRDGFAREGEDTPCVLVVGAKEMGALQMVFEKGRLQFEGASFVAAGERIRLEEHPQWGIPFGQCMALVKGEPVPLRLVLETGQWPSRLHERFWGGQSLAEEDFSWEALRLSLETALPAGNFERGGAKLNRYWPWAEGSLGMGAFECCRFVWSPKEGAGVVTVLN